MSDAFKPLKEAELNKYFIDGVALAEEYRFLSLNLLLTEDPKEDPKENLFAYFSKVNEKVRKFSHDFHQME